MNKFSILFLTTFIAVGAVAQNARTSTINITPASLQDKIKGGWAGQTIGVTYGGPVEFRFNGTMINDYQPIVWYDGYIRKTMEEIPGLYDDLYMDLTFVDVFEKKGIEASVDEHAKAYANAGYVLWHANQAGRYNILNGIPAPQSGHWLNNPHADDIDFQIEADFSGLMSPGMPNTAAKIGDGIGHIMNYGDGWYGGVYVGAMYSLAFVSNDINYIVKEGLKTIPTQSTFYKCIHDVITWHDKYPNDWKQTWFEIQKKWADDIGCPDGVFNAFNIDAKVNAAYIVLGLLYGNGDFKKTLEISARAGQDADCNPSSAGGILGTMLGYENIPAYWKMGLKEAEDIDFKYTTMSLNDVYKMGYKHALQVIQKNGGKVTESQISLPVETPQPVRLEQNFEGHYPVEKRSINKNIENEFSFDFVGTGFVMKGEVVSTLNSRPGVTDDFFFTADLYVDGKKVETAKLPASYTTRRPELFWRYQLPEKDHKVQIKILPGNSSLVKHDVRMTEILIYESKPRR
ncbi:MAG TPA: ADP-ribosylglycohydrolase family protein [Cyclobacteriaceae bacterium]|nr:ADP-ribosylglycohydrolase family protein [Cyclobacteriaceae bacterium]